MRPTITVFFQSDAVATIYFTAGFVRLLFEGGDFSLESLETSTTAGLGTN